MWRPESDLNYHKIYVASVGLWICIVFHQNQKKMQTQVQECSPSGDLVTKFAIYTPNTYTSNTKSD